MATVGLIVHQGRPEAVAAARDLSQWLTERGHSVRMPPEEAAAAGCAHLEADPDHFADGLEVVVTLGGDGSILRAVELIGEAGVAILGVDFGRMGYLTEVKPEEAQSAINRVLSGDHGVEERMLLVVEFGSPDTGAVPRLGGRANRRANPGHTGEAVARAARERSEQERDTHPRDAKRSHPIAGALSRHVALNEAVVERPAASYALRLGVAVNDEPFTTYAADGLIVATPTGSTAYALSARGPIVDPTHRALLLTPVSPHMLFDRSMVVAADTRLRLEVLDHRGAVLSVDGRRLAELREHDIVVCTASPHPARLVTFGTRRFHQVLKTKFGLNDR